MGKSLAAALAVALAPSPPPLAHIDASTLPKVAGNHGSPSQCFVDLDQWFERTLHNASSSMRVLDVGGGTGAKTLMLRQKFEAHNFQCIDVIDHPVCERFDGERLPFPHRSQDVVFFAYSLHHAGDHALPLLQEATRVLAHGASIAILEDLKADTTLMQRAEAVHMGCSPTEPCIFRGDREWRAIFELLRLRVVEHVTPGRLCARPIPRALYVLQHDSALEGRITVTENGLRKSAPARGHAPAHALVNTTRSATRGR